MTTRRTNNGAMLDIEALLSQQPASSRALGNMNLNVRGDVLDTNGNIVKKSEDRVREYYQSNPKPTTSRVSTKGKLVADQPLDATVVLPPESATIAESIEVEEVELPNGDIEIRKKGKKSD